MIKNTFSITEQEVILFLDFLLLNCAIITALI